VKIQGIKKGGEITYTSKPVEEPSFAGKRRWMTGQLKLPKRDSNAKNGGYSQEGRRV